MIKANCAKIKLKYLIMNLDIVLRGAVFQIFKVKRRLT